MSDRQEVLNEMGKLWSRLQRGGLSDPISLIRDSHGIFNHLAALNSQLSQTVAEITAQGGGRTAREVTADARNLCRVCVGLLWAMRRVGMQGTQTDFIRAALGSAYGVLGRHERAVYRLRRSLPAVRRQMPPGNEIYLALEFAYANSRLAVGQDAEILPDLEQVIFRAHDAGSTSMYLQKLETLRNSLYARTGDREYAQTISETSLEDCVRRFGAESPQAVDVMCELAQRLELPRGNVVRATELLSRCLYVLEMNQGAPWVRPARIGVEILAAEIEQFSGNNEEGIRHLEMAEEEARSYFDDHDRRVIELTLRLAGALEDAGHAREALGCLKKLARDVQDAAWMPPGQRARFTSIYTSCLMNLWEFGSFKDNYPQFLRDYKEEIRRRRSWSGEDVQLNNSQEIWNLIGLNLGMLLINREGIKQDEIKEAFLHVVEFKGRVAEAMCISREHRLKVLYPEYRRELEELAKVRQELQELDAGFPQAKSSQELLNKKRRVEEHLTELVPELSWLPPSIEDLAVDLADLDEDCVLLDFVHIGPAKDSFFGSFAIFILPSGQPRHLRIDSLDSSQMIAELVKELREAFREALRSPTTSGRQYIEMLETLWTRVWQPVEAALDDLRGILPGRSFRRVFISLDHCLTWLPFQALRNPQWPPDHYLIDEYEISYLSTSRDIVNIPDLRARRGARPVAIGLNRFDVGYDGSVTPPHSGMFGTLREAENQAQRVGELLEGEVWTGAQQVTKERLFEYLGHISTTQPRDQNYRSPAIIHFASHGFVGSPGDREIQQFDDIVRMDAIQEALRRSGLALSGACASIDALSSPEPLPPSLPGILNAYEISGLDLRDTQLVVLATCEGGFGTLSSGEGVFGLQRSFFTAGAHSLIMALWPVEQGVTAKLMEAFYRRLSRGKSRSEALRYAQLQVRERGFKHPAFWASFICQGNPLAIGQIVRQSTTTATQANA